MKRFCQLMGDTWSEFESCVIVSGLTAVHKDELTAWAGAEDCDITFEAGTREDETFVVKRSPRGHRKVAPHTRRTRLCLPEKRGGTR